MENQPASPVSSTESNESFSPTGFKKTGPPVFLLGGLALVGFLSAALVFTYLSKPKAPKLAKPEAETPPSPKPVTNVVEVTPLPKTSDADEEASMEEKPIPTLVLSGILFGKDGSMALINGRIIREGSSIDGARLVKISSDRVEFKFEGQKIVLRLK